MVGRSSNGHSSRVRDVVFERSFEFMAQLLRIDAETLDEKLEGLILTLPGYQSYFQLCFEMTKANYSMRQYMGGQPTLVVWFTFDANAVHLRFITRALPEDDAD